MIRAYVFRQGREVTDVDIDSLSEVRTEKGTVVWVDLVSPTEPELAKIAEEFGVEESTLRECARRHQRPKLEENGDYLLVVSYGAKLAKRAGIAELHELDILAGKGWLITVHGGKPLDSEETARRVGAHPEMFRSGSGFLLYVVLDELVDTFFPALDRIGERIENLEQAIFQDRRPTQVSATIFQVRKELIAIRRLTGPMRDAMVVLLRRDLGFFSSEAQSYLQEV
jgi:magnesium transporter